MLNVSTPLHQSQENFSDMWPLVEISLFKICSWTIFICFVIILIIKIQMRRQKIPKIHRKAVFVTGCDSGFGRLVVHRLLNLNMKVFAGCYKKASESSLIEEAKNLGGKLVTMPLDVTCSISVENAACFVETHLEKKGLWGLINNAGIIGNILDDDLLHVEDYQRTLNVNTLGVVRITHAFKSLVKKCRGRIVIVTSVHGCFALPLINTFCVSQYATEAYADLIRRELFPFGVSVHIIEPGFSATSLTNDQHVTLNINRVWRRAHLDLRKEYGAKYFQEVRRKFIALLHKYSSSPVPVVDAYVHALTAAFPKNRYWVGWDAILIFRLLSVLPTAWQDRLYQIWKKFSGIPAPKCASATSAH